MTERSSRSSRQLSSLLRSIRAWILRNRWVFIWMVRAGKLVVFLWNAWHRFKGGPWPFYRWKLKGERCNTKHSGWCGCFMT